MRRTPTRKTPPHRASHFKVRWTNRWLPCAQLGLNDFNRTVRREPRPHLIPMTSAAAGAMRRWHTTPIRDLPVIVAGLCFGTAILPSGKPVIAFRFKRIQRPGFAEYLLGMKRELDGLVNLSTPQPVNADRH